MPAIMLPKEVDWVLDLLGFQWPDADEDKMREAAKAWSDFADAVRGYQQQGHTAANTVRGANSGEAVDAFGTAWKKVGDGYLDDVAEAAVVLAVVLDVVSTIVMVMKFAVIVQLLALAVEFALAQAAAPVTLGASEAGAAAATATTRVMVRRIFNEAKTKIVQAVTEALEKKAAKKCRELLQDLAKDLGKDAAKGIGQNIVSQGIQGYFGAQDGFDAGKAARAGLGPLVSISDSGAWRPGDKLKDVGKVFTGEFHTAQGIGKVAQGDFAAGGKQIWEGQQETAEGVKTAYDMSHKDKEPAAEGDGTGDGDASGGDSGSASDGGSAAAGSGGSSSAGSGSDGSSSSAPAGGARSRLADGIPDNEAPGTEDDQDEAARVRNAFG
ncbi:hypothetical protein GCM10012285_33610 [Streptomyces kronopolitis]|uniref:Outer membrane channel protein CpnT-like N-terminal domain-containing protein n=1 Tax=Streptomyces kronopolitis TaxID=1612435 RepID=A0ABQ2JLN3_9ACTN|nr:hypothetical protein [Streptomyces kronopolitis]GGN47648.1 hypothetical protein GCM10012285_33610 [Streptomyces kronopolitis]